MGQDEVTYDASHIEVLEGLQAIRRRPGMYVMSTGPQGLHNQLFELSDWAFNEVLAGHGDRVAVTLRPDGSVSITLHGRGVPVAAAGDEESPTLEDLLSGMYVTPPVGRRGVCCAPFAVGPVVANALSSRLDAEVRRQGTHWTQRYERGAATCRPLPAGRAAGDGTVITFRPDPDVFGTAEHSFDLLAETFGSLAHLWPGLDVTLTDERGPGSARSERYRFPGGATAPHRRSGPGDC
ncbi:hypothetical protein [Streptomyces sp. CO7]